MAIVQRAIVVMSLQGTTDRRRATLRARSVNWASVSINEAGRAVPGPFEGPRHAAREIFSRKGVRLGSPCPGRLRAASDEVPCGLAHPPATLGTPITTRPSSEAFGGEVRVIQDRVPRTEANSRIFAAPVGWRRITARRLRPAGYGTSSADHTQLHVSGYEP